MAYDINKFVTDGNPLPVSIEGENMPYDPNKIVTKQNPYPVSIQSGDAGGGGSNVYGQTPASGAINGVNKVYTLPTAAAQDTVRGYIGATRIPPSELALSLDGLTVTLDNAPQTGDELYFDYEET